MSVVPFTRAQVPIILGSQPCIAGHRHTQGHSQAIATPHTRRHWVGRVVADAVQDSDRAAGIADRLLHVEQARGRGGRAATVHGHGQLRIICSEAEQPPSRRQPVTRHVKWLCRLGSLPTIDARSECTHLGLRAGRRFNSTRVPHRNPPSFAKASISSLIGKHMMSATHGWGTIANTSCGTRHARSGHSKLRRSPCCCRCWSLHPAKSLDHCAGCVSARTSSSPKTS
jgi:hypothetical protein